MYQVLSTKCMGSDFIELAEETYLEYFWISKMEVFAKIIDSSQPLTTFVKVCSLDAWQGSEYTSILLLIISR